ncbi:MAG: hypothetical protein RMJ84_13945, partial [Sandaracinaceae bacterium]|nr:hypothetical protein [Sandaracinaceae bacterium]
MNNSQTVWGEGKLVSSYDGGFGNNPWHIALAPKDGDARRMYSVEVVLRRSDGSEWASVKCNGDYEAGQVVTWHIALHERMHCECQEQNCQGTGCMVQRSHGRVEAALCEVDASVGMTDAFCERCGDAGCVDLMSDPQNCGRCGNRCPSGPNSTPVCSLGNCSIQVQAGYADCNRDPTDGCEVDI